MKEECGFGGVVDSDEGIEPETIVRIGDLHVADREALAAFFRRLGVEAVPIAEDGARANDDGRPCLRIVERFPSADDRVQLARNPNSFMLFIIGERFTFPPGLEPELPPTRFDYLRRPFQDSELLWRARSALSYLSFVYRRGLAQRRGVLRCGPIGYDPLRREVRVNDMPLDLRPAERELLAYLISNSDRCVDATEIVKEVLHSSGDGAAARNQIYELRRKLRAAGLPEAISTEGRNGYRIRSSASSSDSDNADARTSSKVPHAR